MILAFGVIYVDIISICVSKLMGLILMNHFNGPNENLKSVT